MKTFIIGLLVGITSFIPGISGGTIFYLSGELDNLVIYFKNIKKYYLKLFILFLGAILGIIFFSPLMELLFKKYPNITKLFFAYLVLNTLPNFIKKIKVKINKPLFILAFLLLIIINYFLKVNTLVYANINITFIFLIFFTICGFLDGFITIIPGISGSMMMMILGPYYLYKSISANILNNPIYLIPLLFYFLGDVVGIIIGSIFTNNIIKKYESISNSLIMGFIVASIFIIIPFKEVVTIEGFIILLISYILSNIFIINAKD